MFAAERSPMASRDTPPNILVLLAAHNGAQWIGKQLESILAQRSVQLRVVIRDDGSHDETLDAIAPFLVDPRVTVARDGTVAGSAAQNFFLLIDQQSAADFDFVAFADQDDVWFPDKLSRSSECLNANGCCGYSSATIATWPDGRRRALRQSATVRAADFLFEGAGQGCTFLLKAAFYGRVRAFLQENPKLKSDLHYHDWAIYALARAWELKWLFDPSPTVNYRQHAGNDTGARASVAGLRKRLLLIRSGWYRAQITAIATLCSAAAPGNGIVGKWRSMLFAGKSWSRRVRIAVFCLRSGRRRVSDNLMLAFTAVAGWI